jgi:hypothetical protein
MEPWRKQLDLEALSSGARDMIVRIERMLADLDNYTGAFAAARYSALPEILDHPFMSDLALPRAKIWSVLERERLSRLCGYPVPKMHDEAYQDILEAAQRWIENTGYERPPTLLRGGKFPLLKKQKQHIKSVLVDAGLQDVRTGGGAGYTEFRFEFPAAFFGKMSGLIEVRTKYDGDTRFSVVGGFLASETVSFMGRMSDVLGPIHYVKCHLEPPIGMTFTMDRDDPSGSLDDMLQVVLSITSYFLPDCSN